MSFNKSSQILGDLFEDESHRGKETEALEWCEDRFKCKAHGFNDKTSALDFWLERDGEVVAFGDVKSRGNRLGAYPTLWVSTRKIVDMTIHSSRHAKPVLLVVPFGCGETRWLDVMDLDTPMEVFVWSRRVHRASNDTEPAFEIKLSDLRK